MICKVVKLNNHIYLTNDEEIKVDDWCYSTKTELFVEYSVDRPANFKQWYKKIIASTESLNGVLQIPDEFIQICLDNDEVDVELDYDYKADESGLELQIFEITPVEKVQEIEITIYDEWWNNLSENQKANIWHNHS